MVLRHLRDLSCLGPVHRANSQSLRRICVADSLVFITGKPMRLKAVLRDKAGMHPEPFKTQAVQLTGMSGIPDWKDEGSDVSGLS
jgi:hypothetical protein